MSASYAYVINVILLSSMFMIFLMDNYKNYSLEKYNINDILDYGLIHGSFISLIIYHLDHTKLMNHYYNNRIVSYAVSRYILYHLCKPTIIGLLNINSIIDGKLNINSIMDSELITMALLGLEGYKLLITRYILFPVASYFMLDYLKDDLFEKFDDFETYVKIVMTAYYTKTYYNYHFVEIKL